MQRRDFLKIAGAIAAVPSLDAEVAATERPDFAELMRRKEQGLLDAWRKGLEQAAWVVPPGTDLSPRCGPYWDMGVYA